MQYTPWPYLSDNTENLICSLLTYKADKRKDLCVFSIFFFFFF